MTETCQWTVGGLITCGQEALLVAEDIAKWQCTMEEGYRTSYLRRFEYVVAIAETGSFSRAADRLNITQPTLSKFVQKLERDIGAELFDRSTIPVKLTKAGELFLNVGRRILDQDRQLRKRLRDIGYQQELELRVGISPSRAPYLLPMILSEYSGSSVAQKIVVREATVAGLSEQLTAGELDIIISLSGDDTVCFERVDLFDETILLAVPKLFGRQLDVEQALVSLPQISVGKGQFMWNIMDTIRKAVGGREPIVECQSIEAGVSLVRQGIGIMIVPSYVRDYGSESLNDCIQFFELSSDRHSFLEGVPRRTVGLFYRKEQFLTQEEKRFIECAVTVAKRISARATFTRG